MSATTIAPRTGLSAAGIIRSEWIKLRSLRSTVWSYAIVIVISLGLSWVFASALSNTDFGPLLDSPERTLVQASTFGVTFGVLVASVLGVLNISGEYSTGMIRSTLTAVPKRIPVLAAKALILFVATFVVGLVATAGSALVAFAVLGSNGVVPELTGEVVTGILFAALYLAAVAVFALGLGTILRSSAGGIAAAVGVLLILPTVVTIVAGVTQAQWAVDAMPYLLSSAGEAMLLPTDGGLEQWQSGLVVAAWALVPLAAGAILLKKRDA